MLETWAVGATPELRAKHLPELLQSDELSADERWRVLEQWRRRGGEVDVESFLQNNPELDVMQEAEE